MSHSVILITGASSGFGLACAERLGRAGHCVYGVSRRAPAEPQLDQGIWTMRMDVQSDESVQKGVERVLQREGRIDVLINNAGYCIAGPVEETPIDEAQAEFETNFWGMLRLCQAVLPSMRARRAGLIINISSIAGRISQPFQGFYAASKFAIEGLTEALSMEVKPFNIRVVMIEPGDFHTGFTANRRSVEPGPAYRDNMARALKISQADELNGAKPAQLAALVERVIRSHRPRLRYMVGPWYQQIAAGLKKIGWDRLFEWGLMQYYKQGR